MNRNSIRASVEALHAYVPGEQPRDRSFIKLNTNENPYPPSPAVDAALHRVVVGELRRYPPPVADALRERIAEIHACQPENVFVGNGSDEILALCTRAFVENDGRVGFFDPSYSLYPVLAAIRDVETSPVALGAGFTWQMPDFDQTSLFFLTNPNAPTGMSFPITDIQTFCQAYRGVVLIDEAYADFADENCMALATAYDNVLVSRSLSKSYSLAGLRVGYCVGHTALIGALYKLKDSYNLDCIAQKLALAALMDQSYMQANVKQVKRERERLSAFLRGLSFVVYPSQTNFLWVHPPAPIAAVDYVSALRESGILIRYFPQAGLADHVRITVGTAEEMNALMTATEAILQASL